MKSRITIGARAIKAAIDHDMLDPFKVRRSGVTVKVQDGTLESNVLSFRHRVVLLISHENWLYGFRMN